MNKTTFVTKNAVEKVAGGLPRRAAAHNSIEPDAYLVFGKKRVALFELSRAATLTRALMAKKDAKA
jgi:hypothetical protein